MSARPGPYGGYHAEWYPYRDQQPGQKQRGLTQECVCSAGDEALHMANEPVRWSPRFTRSTGHFRCAGQGRVTLKRLFLTATGVITSNRDENIHSYLRATKGSTRMARR